MLMQPRNSKYRKSHKGRLHGKATRGEYLSYGKYGLKVTRPALLTAQQLESCRRVIRRFNKRIGRLFIRVFPYKPVTKKPAEVRMGKGKGNVELWVAPVLPGTILFELDGVSRENAMESFKRASAKLPVPTRFVELIGVMNS